jgi:hypothetical protein
MNNWEDEAVATCTIGGLLASAKLSLRKAALACLSTSAGEMLAEANADLDAAMRMLGIQEEGE